MPHILDDLQMRYLSLTSPPIRQMPTIRKLNGKYQAQVRRDGFFKSATFYKKSDATD